VAARQLDYQTTLGQKEISPLPTVRPPPFADKGREKPTRSRWDYLHSESRTRAPEDTWPQAWYHSIFQSRFGGCWPVDEHRQSWCGGRHQVVIRSRFFANQSTVRTVMPVMVCRRSCELADGQTLTGSSTDKKKRAGVFGSPLAGQRTWRAAPYKDNGTPRTTKSVASARQRSFDPQPIRCTDRKLRPSTNPARLSLGEMRRQLHASLSNVAPLRNPHHWPCWLLRTHRKRLWLGRTAERVMKLPERIVCPPRTVLVQFLKLTLRRRGE